ncbi:MAG: tetraacyldisaccharide 4'-kinase [Paracoccaceae bacterium]
MTPGFWHRPPGPLLRRIGPLAPGRRHARTSVDAAPVENTPVPVLSVGSLTLGGTGKTPAVIALAQRLATHGRAVHVVTGGPGHPFRVDERGHDAGIVGDEPLLIAAFAPTWVAADPAQGIAAAARAGAEVVVLDAGVGPPPVAATAAIAVEDALRGLGNGYAWPLGPLAERLETGMNRVDLLLAIGPPEAQQVFDRDWSGRLSCPVLPAHLAPLPTGMDWAGLDVIAFAGIGAPERFFATLRGLGANLIRAQALNDHQEMTPALLARLDAEARRAGAQLVTTEKDAVRLPKHFRPQVVSLPVRLEPADWAPIDALLP